MQEIIWNFYHKMMGIRDISHLLMHVPELIDSEADNTFNEFLQRNCTKNSNGSYIIPSQHAHQFKRLSYRRRGVQETRNLVPKALFLGVISDYDAFIGLLISKCFKLRPEILKSLDKKICFSEIADIATIDGIREFVLDKEVDGILRCGHLDHLKWFMDKFGIELFKDVALISEFVEVTEARNLLAHNDGIINSQYIQMCQKYSIDVSKKQVGTKIELTNDYLKHCIDVVLEIGFKLANIIWRNIAPNEIEKSDKEIINIVYDLIDAKHYSTAIRLGVFFADKRIIKDENSYLMILINVAQAYKWNQDQRYKNFLQKEQWNSKAYHFKLAKQVLMDEFQDAAKTMEKIGSESTDLRKNDYENWPLFVEFRATELFKTTYEQIFLQPYSSEPAIVSAMDLIKKDSA